MFDIHFLHSSDNGPTVLFEEVSKETVISFMRQQRDLMQDIGADIAYLSIGRDLLPSKLLVVFRAGDGTVDFHITYWVEVSK